MGLKKTRQKTTSKRRREAAAAEEIKAIRYQKELLKLEHAKLALARDEARLAAMKEAEEAQASGLYEPTLEALSRRFGLSRQVLGGMMRDPGAPRKHGNKGYLVKEWGAWLLTPAPISEEKKQLLRLKTALWDERTADLKRQNDERAALFMPREQFENDVREYSEIVLDAIKDWPQRVRARCPGSDALLGAVEETCAEIRHVVAEHLERIDRVGRMP